MWCIKVYSALSIAGAGLAIYGIESSSAATIAAIFFIAGLGISVLMSVRKFESTWYRARAIAESVKTASWRFTMCAEPFNNPANIAVDKKAFTDLLRVIMLEHKDSAHVLSGSLAQAEQITPAMINTRSLPLAERMQMYRDHRIDDQRKWYARESDTNKRLGNRWFWILIGLQAGAVLFVVLRIAEPTFKYWPTEVFVVAATSVFGWMQIKRFRELAAAYGVTAHEIGLARSRLDDITTEQAFSEYVGDTENAFSREHTQWAARKDVG